jgi:hypothetical protein
MTINCLLNRCKNSYACIEGGVCMAKSLTGEAWTPISLLPPAAVERKEEVLVAYDDGVVCSMGADEAAGIVIGGLKGWYVGKLTHWMQLPEPPKQTLTDTPECD